MSNFWKPFTLIVHLMHHRYNKLQGNDILYKLCVYALSFLRVLCWTPNISNRMPRLLSAYWPSPAKEPLQNAMNICMFRTPGMIRSAAGVADDQLPRHAVRYQPRCQTCNHSKILRGLKTCQGNAVHV